MIFQSSKKKQPIFFGQKRVQGLCKLLVIKAYFLDIKIFLDMHLGTLKKEGFLTSLDRG
jgi:hypothetical protein